MKTSRPAPIPDATQATNMALARARALPDDQSYLEDKPVRLLDANGTGFVLGPYGVEVAGQPKFNAWAEAVWFAISLAEASPYWVGDLLAYIEKREDYDARLEVVRTARPNLTLKTIHNLTSISRGVSVDVRREAPSFTHARAVVGLAPKTQVALLRDAKTNGWTAEELAANIRAEKRRAVIEGQAKLTGRYRVIVADPPWAYDDAGRRNAAAAKYPTMTLDDICKLPVGQHAMPNAVLLLWVPVPMLLQNPGPREVIEAWGFEYRSNMVWCKPSGMPGSYVHVDHEHLIIAVRGLGMPDHVDQMFDNSSVLRTNKGSREHSEKPDEVHQRVERLWDGPYLELFARKKREGWTVYGNDAALWVEK